MNAMQTPLGLSESPSMQKIYVPDYDWGKQTRGDGYAMGRFTHNSAQTFRPNGTPWDATGDNND